ncbi:hypothetical protein AA2016_1571 [Aminobacter aminovorans]|uniref:Uncharacterized protein n=1 Tax=Aminobacter aminovorans TaxID=83263 RepID=A0AAC8YLE7_AMIAI|nr:hypothetical protein AA2016_1571 [Aminobacter aminovorans]
MLFSAFVAPVEWSLDDKPDLLTLVSYMIAAAILLPVGWWLKENQLFGFGAWVVSWFH